MHVHCQRRLVLAIIVSFFLLSNLSPALAGPETPPRAPSSLLIQHVSFRTPALPEPSIARRAIALAHLARKRALQAAARERRAAARQLARVRYLGGADWFAVARCESGIRWSLNVGTFDGGLQFLPSTWDAAGGRRFARYAWQATPAQQVTLAARLLARSGPSQWPYCFRPA